MHLCGVDMHLFMMSNALSDQNTAATELKLAVWFWKLHTDMHAVNNN